MRINQAACFTGSISVASNPVLFATFASIIVLRWRQDNVNIIYIIGRMAMTGEGRPAPAHGCAGVPTMPIRQLLDSNAFNPEEVTMLRDVFEDTLRALKLVDRSDPVTLLIAKKIIELARRGERVPARLRQAAVQAFADAPERPETPASTVST
jgi:hypothetical protein